MLEPADLDRRGCGKIEHALATPYPQHRIAADGARLTAQAIGTILEQRRVPIRPAPPTP